MTCCEQHSFLFHSIFDGTNVLYFNVKSGYLHCGILMFKRFYLEYAYFQYWFSLKFSLNPLNAELNLIWHLLVLLLGDLTFMGPCIVSIFQYISNKMHRYTVYLYLETAQMFRVVLPPIMNCIYSIWYLSHRYCYLPLSWNSWNRF
jgi:hypothetical protein